MYNTLLLATAFACTVAGRPSPDVTPHCKDIPVNPYLPSYLQNKIPGCDGSSAVTNPNARLGNIPVVDQSQGTVQSPPPAVNSPPPAVNSPPPLYPNIVQQNYGSNPSSSPRPQLSSGGADLSRNFSASITRYGEGPAGTPGTDDSCHHNQGACGNNPINGYTAAVGVFLYVNGASGMGGDGSPGVPGKACGTCWRVEGVSDLSHVPMQITPIVVLITNECAAAPPGEPVNSCGMKSFDEHDVHGNEVLVDLCMDTGASQAFWGPPPWGASIGSTVQVECSEWCGTWANGTKSGPAGCVPGTAPWEVGFRAPGTR